METFDILDRVIFSVGTWNGDKWTEKDLDDAVKAFTETRGKLRPPLKLGHNKEQKITNGLPAIGWVDNIRKVGNDLVADFKKVPKVIYELLNAGAYRTVSAEFWRDVLVDGKQYPFVFKGLALLGADLPAVDSVSDIINMYEVDEKTEVKAYSVEMKNEEKKEVKNEKSEDNKMEKEIIELKAKVADLEAKEKTASENYSKEKEGLDTKVTELEASLKESNEKCEEMENEKNEAEKEKIKAEYTADIDKLIADKKIAPANKEKMLEFMLNMPIEKKFKEGEKEVSYADSFVEMFSKMPELDINTDENSEAGKNQVTDEEALIVKYAKDNKMKYKEALIELAKQNKIKG